MDDFKPSPSPVRAPHVIILLVGVVAVLSHRIVPARIHASFITPFLTWVILACIFWGLADDESARRPRKDDES